MSQSTNGFRLQDLVDKLPPARRALIIEIRDPSHVSDRLVIEGGRAVELARPSDLVFCKTTASRHYEALLASASRVAVAPAEVADALPESFSSDRIVIVTSRPRLLMASLLMPFDAPPAVAKQREMIHPDARIASSALIGPGVVLGADVVIAEHAVVGANCVIDHTTIGAGTQISFNCSIGSDGFGYEIDEESGEIVKFPHFGRVHIGRNVEIASNTCIDRGSLNDTVIEDDVKIDNLVHVAHNCRIERGAFLIANSMIGGSTVVGEYAWIAPSTSLLNGIGIGRLTMTGMGSVVIKSVAENEIVAGLPAKKLRNRFADDSPMVRK